jgi:hypothetical protein
MIARRMALRDGHFMPALLLDSQFAALEEPTEDEDALVVSIEPPPAEITWLSCVRGTTARSVEPNHDPSRMANGNAVSFIRTLRSDQIPGYGK